MLNSLWLAALARPLLAVQSIASVRKVSMLLRQVAFTARSRWIAGDPWHTQDKDFATAGRATNYSIGRSVRVP